MQEQRRTADRLAQLLGDQRGAETIVELRRLAHPRSAAQWQPRPPQAARPRFVGVWEIVDTPGGPGLRRRQKVPLWDSCVWSSEGDVPGKADAKRVVLVGESAARGYLLDPVFNPAIALRRYLASAPYQCVDLAQTSIRLPQLRNVIAASAHLDTDVLVVFAGNNWTTTSDDLPGTDYPPSSAGVLREQGYRGLRDCIREEVVIPQVRGLFGDLELLRDEAGIQPVMVVPEFNLTGWSPLGGKEMDVPMLPEAALARWYELRSGAEQAIVRGEWESVRAAALEMAELDRGLSPVPGFLLGRALQATGDAGAREAYERSRDSTWGLPVRSLPRMSRELQDMMRDFGRRAGVACVDLPRLLAGPDPLALPDPAHFLDYCHLSASGIDIAMAAVAEVITGGPGECHAHEPLAPPVDGRTTAVSLVLAAAYNSFCGQPPVVVAGYLRRAVADYPLITELLDSLGQVLGRPGGPMWSGAGFGDLAREANMAAVLLRLGEYRPDKSRVWSLREGLADVAMVALTELPGLPASGAALDRRQLLDISTTGLGLGNVPNYTQPRCYLQANTNVTNIELLLAAPEAAVLRVTHRCREAGAGPAAVRFNGELLGTLAATAHWQETEFTVPCSVTGAGVNLIAITWPGPAVSWQARMREDVDALARGEHAYVLPIFGELFSVLIETRPQESADAAEMAGPARAGRDRQRPPGHRSQRRRVIQ
jgi:hypothetical protein